MAEKSYKVIGAAVVLPLEVGSERYLYRNAVVAGKGFTKDGIEHALKVGLIEETESASVADDDETAAEKAAAAKKAEAEKAEAEKKAAAEKAAAAK